MMTSEELFLFFAQIGKHSIGSDDGTGRPEFWVPEYGKAYRDFVITNVIPPQGLHALSDEIFLIFKQMIKFDYFHKNVLEYLEVEKSLRQLGKSKFTYDIANLESQLNVVASLFQAQYSAEEKSKLKLEKIPEDLITATGGRLVLLKDYLFHKGPSSQIPATRLLNHLGQIVDWPQS